MPPPVAVAPIFAIAHLPSAIHNSPFCPMTSSRSPKRPPSAPATAAALLKKLGLQTNNPGVFCGEWLGSGKPLPSVSPIDGHLLATVRTATPEEYERTARGAQEAFLKWQLIPAPKRGEVVRQLGNALREAKRDLGRLVTLEAGKILAEGEGEVQEMIDVCDYALGLSRQLYGLTIASERPQHRMMEQWHPLGIVGIVTAFNFPVAVWAWNSAIATVCGNATIWKPSSQTPLTALATIQIAERICRANNVDPAIFSLVIGDGATVGERLINDTRIPLVSATGSTKMGRHVGEVASRRLGRSLLELGGNNAIIVTPTADLDLAMRAILLAQRVCRRGHARRPRGRHRRPPRRPGGRARRRRHLEGSHRLGQRHGHQPHGAGAQHRRGHDGGGPTSSSRWACIRPPITAMWSGAMPTQRATSS